MRSTRLLGAVGVAAVALAGLVNASALVSVMRDRADSDRGQAQLAASRQFEGPYGTRFDRCLGAERLRRGGSDLRVIAVSCRDARRLVLSYAPHPAVRIESVTTFGCYSYRPRTGRAAQRIVCIDSAGGTAFRFDIG